MVLRVYGRRHRHRVHPQVRNTALNGVHLRSQGIIRNVSLDCTIMLCLSTTPALSAPHIRSGVFCALPLGSVQIVARLHSPARSDEMGFGPDVAAGFGGGKGCARLYVGSIMWCYALYSCFVCDDSYDARATAAAMNTPSTTVVAMCLASWFNAPLRSSASLPTPYRVPMQLEARVCMLTD